MDAYAQALSQLFALGRRGVDLGLERVRQVARALGEPQRAFEVVHVGGTNGKGSTAAMIEAILRAAGRRTGLFTSPHLSRFTERVCVDGREIGRDDVVRLLGVVDRAAAGVPLTFFEVATLLALCHFREQGVEIAVLEVGLGGRLDATNLVEDPLCALVTQVALDHCDLLGTTLAEVAREKAGIFKPGRPALAAPPADPAAAAVLAARAAEIGAPLLRLGPDFALEPSPSGAGLSFRGPGGPLEVAELGLSGAHQRRNAALALAAVGMLGRSPLPAAAILQGLRGVHWPARLELVARAPRIVLDCAHNPEAARALAASLPGLGPGPVFLVFGVLDDKDAAGMLDVLGPPVVGAGGGLWLCAPASPRAADPQALRRAVPEARVVPEPAAALAAACRAARAAGEGALVLVAGSIYLCGEIRRLLLGEPADPLAVGDPLPRAAAR